jgi:dTDP-L-rhamnose 4-epimerase
MSRVLLTGGAGFIGSHVARRLLECGHRVRVLDDLDPQVHEAGDRPGYLDHEVELVAGDVRDRSAVERALEGVDRVVHFAAKVGVGQSMYEIAGYTSTNCVGTAVLLESLLERPVERLLVASSMSVYGEGLYRDPKGWFVEDARRSRLQLEHRRWEPLSRAGEGLEPVPTPETKVPDLSSVYALTKYDQERLCLMFGSAYDVPAVALRFFNVYGPDQALSNPYTGVLAIFASRLLNGRPPKVFEDGEQRRDFVSVHDVAHACVLALESDSAVGHTINIGSGRSASVMEVAERLAKVLDRQDVEPEITGRYRVGDVRHCFADIARARELLGYEPAVGLKDGMAELAGWLEGKVAKDRVDDATGELASRGLTV